ncbi:MAG: AAA family ATPase [Candidatus Eremiobacteraeota bacterium]|nr:AAA family ATPase [Candidatus Eremiobacteraeota bacterium]MBC5802882.1 AAA family ATPase [Candidatus Eremiobacteraeota bacterium]MBC5823945.1 AAA family ATPase [Candidatus Eremiobacteraeota bacterium]
MATNPYRPGPGLPPSVLAGREAALQEARLAADAVASGLGTAPLVYFGLRGVGKTVLIRAIARELERNRFFPLIIEAEKGRAFSRTFTEVVGQRIDDFAALGTQVGRGAKRLLGVLPTVSFDLPNETGSISLARAKIDENPNVKSLVDSLTELNAELSRARRPLLIAVDEAQEADLATLRAVLRVVHASMGTERAILGIFAGTPTLRAHLGRAHTYAERFSFSELTMLDTEDTRRALVVPAEQYDTQFTSEALERLVNVTSGYPYFVQLYGAYSWQTHQNHIIETRDVESAIPLVEEKLDAGFYRVRLDRLSPREVAYVMALGSLGPGIHGVSEVAARLGRSVRDVSSVRNRLIEKGMLYSPLPGAIAFSVPLFERFIERHRTELERVLVTEPYDRRKSNYRLAPGAPGKSLEPTLRPARAEFKARAKRLRNETQGRIVAESAALIREARDER